MENKQTHELIVEISKGGIPPFKSTPGRGGGTFVTKKLVYAYAMWISPKFYDHVISTYDALVTGQIQVVQPAAPGSDPRLKVLSDALPAVRKTGQIQEELCAGCVNDYA